MSHSYFVKLDENNVVITATRLEDSTAPDEATGVAYLNKIYNTNDVWKISPRGVSKGYTYDSGKNKFISPRPYLSWTLNQDNQWISPIEYPNDGKSYSWDEDNQSWVIRP
jgi:hypothetical protein